MPETSSAAGSAGDSGPAATAVTATVTAPASGAAPTTAAAASEAFLPGTVSELRKVVWPSRQQLFSESVAVILMVSLSAAAIAALDRFLHWVSASTFPIR